MTTSIKTCFKCGAEKPLTEYYRHKQMGDGHLNKCKCCTKMDVRARRFAPRFREKVLSYDRQRGSRQGPDYREAHREYREEEYKARHKLSNAVRDGKMQRRDRCQHCHVSGVRIEGHHEDYSKPFDVVWLCVPCHRQLHAFKDTIAKALNKTSDNQPLTYLQSDGDTDEKN